jgi:predicted transcriptional regulator
MQKSRQRRRRIALMKAYRAFDKRMDEIAVLLLGDTPQDADALAQEFREALEFQRCVETEVFG